MVVYSSGWTQISYLASAPLFVEFFYLADSGFGTLCTPLVRLAFFVSALFPPLVRVFASTLVIPSPQTPPLCYGAQVGSFGGFLTSSKSFVSNSMAVSAGKVPRQLGLAVPLSNLC